MICDNQYYEKISFIQKIVTGRVLKCQKYRDVTYERCLRREENVTKKRVIKGRLKKEIINVCRIEVIYKFKEERKVEQM